MQEVFPRMNTLVKLRENSFLSASERNELLRAASLDALYKSLTASGFFTFAEPKSPEELSDALDEEKRGWLNWAREVTPKKYLAEIFALPDIAHNVSVFIKERAVGRDLSALYEPAQYSKDAIAALVEASGARRSIENAIEAILVKDGEKRRPVERAITQVVEDALEDYAAHGSFLRVDLLVKFFYHKELLRMSRALGDEKISEIVSAIIDLDLLSAAAQRPSPAEVTPSLLEKAEGGLLAPKLKDLFSASQGEQSAALSGTPYAELWGALSRQGSQDLFDALADNFLMEKCRVGRLTPFGLVPLFALVMAKLIEIKSVRVIYEAKRMGAEQSEIAKRVRDEYAV